MTIDGGWRSAGYRLGRRRLRQIATIVTPDTLAALASAADRPEMDVRATRPGRRGVLAEIRRAGRADGGGESDVGLHADPRRAQECRASRRPLDDRPDSQSRTACRRCRSARPRGRRFCARTGARSPGPISSRRRSGRGGGWCTFYTVFVIDLASRRVQIVGSTPHPNDLFMRQVSRTLTTTDDGLLGRSRPDL